MKRKFVHRENIFFNITLSIITIFSDLHQCFGEDRLIAGTRPELYLNCLDVFMFAVLHSIFTVLFLSFSSVYLSSFILAVPILKCLGKLSRMSYIFFIAKLKLLPSLSWDRHCFDWGVPSNKTIE